MLKTTNSAVASLVAHGHINPEAQREMQLDLMRALNKAPAGISVHQKQIALTCSLEELTNSFPPDCQAQNILAVVATMILGPRLLQGVSMAETLKEWCDARL